MADELLTEDNWKTLSQQAIAELPPDLRAAVGTHEDTEKLLILVVKGGQKEYLLGIGLGYIPDAQEDPEQPSVYIDAAANHSKLVLLNQTEARIFKRYVAQSALYLMYLLGLVFDHEGHYVRQDLMPILPAAAR
jgi:hypothetical protein